MGNHVGNHVSKPQSRSQNDPANLKRKPVPRDARLESALDQSLESEIPKAYKAIQPLGKGLTSQVYLCLPRKTISSVRKKRWFEKSKTPNPTTLKASLVAIKVLDGFYTSCGDREISVLESIRKHTKTDSSGLRCLQLLASDPMHNWIASRPVLGARQLSNVVSSSAVNGGRMPEEFVWHVFIQMMEALLFLHTKCDPPITYGDLHFGNILVDAVKQDCLGFPNLVLIDFGNASIGGKTGNEKPQHRGMQKDRWKFCSEMLSMSRMVGLCECHLTHGVADRPSSAHACEHTEGWKVFLEKLEEGMGRARIEGTTLSLQELWEQSGARAFRNRASASARARARIREVVFQAMSNRIEQVEKNLLSILDAK